VLLTLVAVRACDPLWSRDSKVIEDGVSGTKADSGLSDAEIISRIGARDEHAMGLLYDRYSRVVYVVALRVVTDAAAAEDILQEVFLRLWRTPQAFDASRGSVASWLAVVARNRAIDHIRKQRPETEPSETIVAVETDLENEAARKQAATKARAILAGMPADQRTALEMAFYQGLTHSEIADKTGQPLGTVKTRIRSGLLTLRKAFAV
jgi:RNA polymerase sigma-70 factor, ECF subfamily